MGGGFMGGAATPPPSEEAITTLMVRVRNMKDVIVHSSSRFVS